MVSREADDIHADQGVNAGKSDECDGRHVNSLVHIWFNRYIEFIRS